jgi:hypothetical protein
MLGGLPPLLVIAPPPVSLWLHEVSTRIAVESAAVCELTVDLLVVLDT